MAATTPTHLIPLPNDWAFWRWACLRGAGFPADIVLRLGSPELAAAVDALREAEREQARAREALLATLRAPPVTPDTDADTGAGTGADPGALRRVRARIKKGQVPADEDLGAASRTELAALREAASRASRLAAELPAAYERALAAAGAVLCEIAAEPRFREAVTWQNQKAVANALDPLTRKHPGALGARERRQQDLVASYLHRYCVKNDTIGFFGPVGWARLEPEGETIVAKPGPELLAARNVYFEQWPIDEIARSLSRDPRWLPWLAPRVYGFVRVDGPEVHSPMFGKVRVSELEAAALAACDGARTAREIAAALADVDEARGVYDALAALRDRKIIAWDLVGGTEWQPNRALRRRLERVGEPELRAEGLGALGAVEEAAAVVAASAGDAGRLGRALTELESTFARVTGAAATHNEGGMYAARGVVFEDCRRDLDLALGPELVAELARPLSLVMESARWLTREAGRAYEEAFAALFARLSRGGRRVPFSDFWFGAQRLVYGASGRPIDPVVAELDRRWTDILEPYGDARHVRYSTDALAPRVASSFGGAGARWAIYHSPDVLLAARGLDALRRGEYYAVLGEVHVSAHTLETNCLARQHPRIEELAAAMRADQRFPRLEVVINKDSHRSGTVRTGAALMLDGDFEIEAGLDRSELPPSSVLRLGDATVEDAGGQLVVSRGEDLRLPILTVMAPLLATTTVNALSIGRKGAHAPRVSFDRLVVSRESWTFPADEVAFPDAKTELQVFVGARAWAEAHGLPRFVFVRSPIETKPVFVDFESPVGVRILARLVRSLRAHAAPSPQGKTLAVTEMLPTLEETWLADAAGRRFTSELRVVVVDRR